jgi:hypothetical protein
VTNIEDRAFYACESLTGITIPNSVTSIGSAVFAGCYALTSINVNSGNPAYVSVTGVLYSQDQTSLIAYPPSEGASSYSVSADVTSIEDRAFEACQNLTNIVIPNSVTNLGFNAMAYCNNLAAVYFEGNAPAFESIGFFNDGSVGGSPFDDDSGATAYYLAGARGWSASYGGAPTAELTAISLSAAPTNGRAPLTVDFTSSNLDQSNNTISNWDWNFNDGLTSVEQNPSHTFTNYGSYAVALVETNSVGVPVAGSAVTVNVLGTPVITSQPSAQTTRLGGIVVLQVQASGAAPLTYQWKFDNAELSNGAHIIGAASNVLKLSDVTTANTGSYMVIVRNQYGSITSAPTVVTILPQGNTKLTIISPKSGQSVSNPVLLVTGTATDTVPVNDVYYQLNGGGWSQATPGSSWSNWTANVTLNRGPNTISAYAEDTSGNFSSTNSISFFYVVTATLVVTNTGKGTLSPDYNNQSLAIGSNYSMTATATAAAGFAFTNWTGGTNQPFTILTNRPKLTFTMESNLTLIANFVDVTPPSLTLTSPTAHQRWSNSLFTATGTARDNVQVSNVFCQLNGGNWMPAAPGNATWSNWTATLTPLQSTNVLAAYAVDTSGNKSATNKVTFLYIPSATLTVQTNGLGAINPVDSGKLLALGTNYTLTASPGRNWLFSNWVGGTTLPYSALSTSSNYSFVMQSNLFLRANFVTNPFLAVAGVYNGLFYPTNGVTEASSGFVSVAIASNSPGAYTAKLLLDGGSNSFSGSFDLTGTARSGKTPVSVTLSLDFNPADALMGGSVSNAAAGWNSVIQADRAVFSATADPATNYAGQFTLLLPPDTNAPVGSPGGYGYAAITNTLGGISTLGGALADGTPFLWSVPVARNGGVPLYQSLYSGKGSLLGWIYFTNEPPQNVSADSSVSWIKPSVPNTLYPSGFTNLTGVLGSPFTNTTKAGVPVLNLTSATLFLSNGNLKGGTLIFTNINSAKNSLTNLAGGTKLGETNYLVLAINTNNGLVTVTFKATGAKTNTVGHGTVLQNQTNAAGYFLGTNQSGAFMLENQ